MANYHHYLLSADHLMRLVDLNFPQAARLKRVMQTGRDGIDGVINARTNPSPTANAKARQKVLLESASKLGKWHPKGKAEIDAIMRDSYLGLDTQLLKLVHLVPDSNAKEIREVFRSLPQPERIPYLTRLATENKAEALAALTEVGFELSGLATDAAKQFRELIYSLHAKDEWELQKTLLDKVDPGFALLRVVKEVADLFSNPVQLEEILQLERQAEAAQQKLNAILS